MFVGFVTNIRYEYHHILSHLIPAEVICKDEDNMRRILTSWDRVPFPAFTRLASLLIWTWDKCWDEQEDEFLFHLCLKLGFVFSQLDLASSYELGFVSVGLDFVVRAWFRQRLTWFCQRLTWFVWDWLGLVPDGLGCMLALRSGGGEATVVLHVRAKLRQRSLISQKGRTSWDPSSALATTLYSCVGRMKYG